MRVFIGVDMESLASKIDTIQKSLSSVLIKSNMTKKENLHLTLYFIGHVDSITSITEGLSKITFNPFLLHVEGLSAFKKKDGDIIYLRVLPNDGLNALYSRITAQLSTLIPITDASYVPHITLYRKAKYENHLDLNQFHLDESVIVNCFHLYESLQVDGKLTYVKLKTFYAK